MSHDTPSQSEQIKAHLKSGYTLTPLGALRLCGCLRLAARIHDIKKDGLQVKSVTVNHGGKRYAEYWCDGAGMRTDAERDAMCEREKANVDAYKTWHMPKTKRVAKGGQNHAKGRAVIRTVDFVETRYEDAREAAWANFVMVGTVYEWIKKGRVREMLWRYE